MTKLIVALDYVNPLDALEMTAQLRDVVDGFKINQSLWSQSVYVKDYTSAGDLFIDCKLWDTPNTVKQVVQKIVDKGATMTTISTLNNTAVFESIEQFSNKIKLLGVTYLTSWSATDLKEIVNQNAMLNWRNNINRVMPYNFAGMICSVKDLDVVNSIAPHMLKVCPGIGKNKGQHRTVDPAEAKNLGADYIVVGRTITQSEFPRDTAIIIKESLV